MKLKYMLGAFVTAMLGVGTAAAQPFPTFAKDPSNPCVKSVATGGGKTFGLGCEPGSEGSVWQRGASAWSLLTANTFSKVAVSGTGVPWFIKANGTVWKWNSVLSAPEEKLNGTSHICASSLGVGQADSDAWVVGCDSTPDKTIWRFNGANTWTSPQPSARATQIAVGSDNIPWVITTAGKIFKWNGSNFGISLSGCAQQIGGKGWIVGCDGKQVWQWFNAEFVQRWYSNAVLQGISNDGLTARVSSGEVLLQGAITTFTIADASPIGDNIEFRVIGNGFAPNKRHRIYYDNPEQGPLQMAAPLTSATGALNVNITDFDGLRCLHMKMKNTNAFFTQNIRVVADGTGDTTTINTTQLFNACF